MNTQKGVIHLALPLLFLLLVAAALFGLIQFGLLKNPFSNLLRSLPLVGSKEPNIAVKTEYKNPFEKSSQYVDPFDQYKSPFLNLKK